MYTLSSFEQRVVASVPLRAERSLDEHARTLKTRANRVQYAISRLLEREILAPLIAVDVSLIGWNRFTVFLTADFQTPRARDAFIHSVIAHDHVAFFAEVSGEFDFEISIVARNIGEAHDIFHTLLGSKALSIRSSEMASRVRSYLFQRKYLSGASALDTIRVFDAAQPPLELSATEERLLSELSRNPTTPQRDLARVCGCALATVNQTLKRLRDKGILKGLIYSVNFERYGAQFYSLQLRLKRFSRSAEKALTEFANRSPQVTHFVVSQGAWDFELGIEVATLSDLREVTDSITAAFGDDILARRAIPRSRVHKFAPYPTGTAN